MSLKHLLELGFLLSISQLLIPIFSVPSINVDFTDIVLTEEDYDFEVLIPSDAISNDDDLSLRISLVPNEWVSLSFFNGDYEDRYGYLFVSSLFVLDDYCVVSSGDPDYNTYFLNISSLDEPIVMEIIENFCDPVISSIKPVFASSSGKDFLYSTCPGSMTKIIDIRDKENPFVVNTIHEGNDNYALYVHGDGLLINDDSESGLYDISEPSNPVLLTLFDPVDAGVDCFNDISFSGNYMYATADSNEFYIYNISSFGTPVEVGSIVDLEMTLPISVFVDGDFAYVGDAYGGGICIINIYDPLSPSVVSYLTDELFEDTARIFVVDGSTAYVIHGCFDLFVIDVSSPTNPIVTQVWNDFLVECVGDKVSANPFAFSNGGGGGKQMIIYPNGYLGYLAIDISGSPTTITEEDNFISSSQSNFEFIHSDDDDVKYPQIWGMGAKASEMDAVVRRGSGNYIYIMGGTESGIKIYDTSLSRSPLLIGSLFSEYISEVFLMVIELSQTEQFLYVPCGQAGVIVVDVSDVENPVIASMITSWEGNVLHAKESEDGKTLFFTDVSAGLYVYNVTDHYNPFFVTSLDEIVQVGDLTLCFRVTIQGDYAYTSCSMYVHIVDISDPYVDLVLVSTIVAYTFVYGIAVDEDASYAYFTCDFGMLFIADISDKNNPFIVSELSLGGGESGTIYEVDATSGKYIYLLSYTLGIVTIDVSDPKNPTIVETVSINSYRNDSVIQSFTSIDKNTYILSSSGIAEIRYSEMKLRSTFAITNFCGVTDVTLIAEDSSGKTEVTFQVSKESYCNDHGECLPDRQCDCSDGYFGEFCDNWLCDGHEFTDVSNVCSGSGDCVEPDNCQCRGLRVGENCETDLVYVVTIVPSATLAVLTMVICVVISCCILVYLCCLFMCCCCLLIGSLARKVRKQKSGLKKFSKLKNFNLYLKEQEIEEDVSIAHLKINKDLFQIEFDEIEIKELLGEGGSNSVVYKTKWKGQLTAFKCFRTRMILSSQDEFGEFEKEVQIMSSVSHPNILQFLGCSLKPPRVGILMEFCENGDLDQFLKKKKSIQKSEDTFSVHCYPLKEKLRMCFEIISAMSYLHDRKIIHRDMKLENVLVDGMERTKLMDFGLSRLVDRMSQENKTSRIGTSVYMAPEIVLSENYSEKVDVFSFAIMMFIIISENFNPYGDHGACNIEIVVANNPNLRPKCKELRKMLPHDHQNWIITCIQNCWNHSPEDRPSFRDLDVVFENKKDELENIIMQQPRVPPVPKKPPITNRRLQSSINQRKKPPPAIPPRRGNSFPTTMSDNPNKSDEGDGKSETKVFLIRQLRKNEKLEDSCCHLEVEREELRKQLKRLEEELKELEGKKERIEEN